MREKKVMKLASRGKRLGAYCIDAIVPFVASLLFIAFLIMLLIAYPYPSFNNGFGDSFGYGYGYGYNSGLSGGMAATIIIALLLMIGYTVAQIIFYSKSSTMGKYILGLQVVSSKDGTPIGFWKMLFREWFVKRASEYVFCLGYIWVLVDDKNRAWHDKILDTYVVDLKESEALNAASAPRRPAPAVHETPAPAAPVRRPQSSPVLPAQPAAAPVEVREEPAVKSTEVQELPVIEPEAAQAPAVTEPEPLFISKEATLDIMNNAETVASVAEDAVQSVINQTEGNREEWEEVQ